MRVYNKIYRRGNKTYQNLTPREKDTDGLSFSIKCPKNNYLETIIKYINSTGELVAKIDNLSTGHVTVYPVNKSKMSGWIESRKVCKTNPHKYTKTLYNIVTKIV